MVLIIHNRTADTNQLFHCLSALENLGTTTSSAALLG
jgi:hypothetical protein